MAEKLIRAWRTLNDAADVDDLAQRMKKVQKAFSRRFPEKSSFELNDLG